MIRAWWSAFAGISARNLLLGTILLALAVSGATAFILGQYYSIDIYSSLIFEPHDCWLDWGAKVGRHCFSDYTMPLTLGLRANAWEPYPVFIMGTDGAANNQPYLNNYTPAGMLPQLTFGIVGKLLHVPQLGLGGYLLTMAAGLLAPAFWAARGARGLEKIVVFVTCGALATPVWAALDRGNSVGFMVPIALVYLLAMYRGRWALVALMVVLAVLVKPQFAVLSFVLLAARQWRMFGLTVAGSALTNFAAYLLWPRDFPHTIVQSIQNVVTPPTPYGWLLGLPNVSFSKALLAIPDGIALVQGGGKVPDNYLVRPHLLAGYVVVLVFAAALLLLGRRIPPVMAGTVLLATASFFPAITNRYYLVFVLPVAALIVRDPDGPPGAGIFDRFAARGERRRVVGVCVSLATALTIAQICLPGPTVPAPIMGGMGANGIVGYTQVVVTTGAFTSIFWLIACVAILVSYARRPAIAAASDQPQAPENALDTADSAEDDSPRPGLVAESSPPSA